MENKGVQNDWNPAVVETKTYEAGYYPNSWTVSNSNAYESSNIVVKTLTVSCGSALPTYSFDFSDLVNYENLTADDFITIPNMNGIYGGYTNSNNAYSFYVDLKNYDSSTGILTIRLRNYDSTSYRVWLNNSTLAAIYGL